MRKRGLEPNERTITQMLVCYAKSDSPHALKNAESWFTKLKDFNMTPSIYHFNSLMRVYNNSSQPEKAIELLKHIEKKGEVVPDAVTYTIALWACPKLTKLNPLEEMTHIWDSITYRADKTTRNPVAPNKQPTSLLARKAAEVKLSDESRYGDKVKETPLKLDDSLVLALLNVGKKVLKGNRK